MIKIRNSYLFSALLVVFLGLFFGGWYIGASKSNKASRASVDALKQEITKLTVQLDDMEYSLTKAEQTVATQKELIKEGELSRKELKAINIKHVNEISKLKFRIDTLLEDVQHGGQIVVIHDTITKQPKNAILLPFGFQKKDQWLDLKGNFDSSGKLGISLKMDMAVDAVSGKDKTTKQPTLNLLTDNPYLQTISVRSYKVDAEKPKHYGIGVFVGYGISKSATLSPLVGAGISYNLIQF